MRGTRRTAKSDRSKAALSSSRPWRSTWTQIHRLVPSLRSFSSRRRFSSKRARCRSWRRSRRAPSAEVRGGFPGPCPQRPRTYRLMSRDTSPCHILSRIRIAFCLSRAHFKDIGQSATLANSAHDRARPRSLRWCFSAPSPRENPHPLPHLTCAHAIRRPNNDNDDHAESRIRIAIEIITASKVWCPSNLSSQGALRARDHRYDADETMTETAAAASRVVVKAACGGGTVVRWREVAATAATARLQTTTTTPRSGHAPAHFWRHCCLGLVVCVAAAASDGGRGTAARATLCRQRRPRRWRRRRGVPTAATVAAPPPPTTARHSHERAF